MDRFGWLNSRWRIARLTRALVGTLADLSVEP
jgi:hypothetical protein